MDTITKDQIQSCDCLLVQGKSVLSFLIQKFEKCNYSHGALFHRFTEPTTLNGITYPIGLYISEMVANGLVLTNFDEYVNSGDNLIICRPKFTTDSKAYWDFVSPMINKEHYGFFNLLVAQPIKYLTNYRIWLGDVNNENPPNLICGEHVERTYNHFNPDYFVNWMQSAPSDIYMSDLLNKFVFKR